MPRRSEFALIDAFRARLGAPHARVVVGSGDDCAVVRPGGALSLVSIDTTVDGVHARLDLGDPVQAAQDFGWRSLTTALSDLAACGVGPGPGADGDTGAESDIAGEAGAVASAAGAGGAGPGAAPGPGAAGIEAYVAITLPPALGDDRVLAISDGMAAAARAFGVSVIGGDVTSGPALVISTTVIGWLPEGEAPLTRSGAQVGDLIGLTGPIGASGAGLALVTERVGDGSTASLRANDGALRRAYLRPVPHLAAGAALRTAGATAGIDLSDGLAADAAHVAVSGGVAFHLDGSQILLAPGVDAVARELGHDPLVFAQSAGEDFVLLVTVPPSARAAAETAGVVAWIGTVVDGPPGTVIGLRADPTGRTGHDHRG